MCPGRPPARASTSSAPASTRSHGPSRSAGSRLPWTPSVLAGRLPAGVERHAPVEPEHVAARRGEQREQRRRGARAEMDRRHVHRREDPGRVRRDELGVVRRGERADPGVEELDRVGAGRRLRGDVPGELLGQPLHQRVPDLRLRVHQRLRAHEVAARAALDEVARDGERPAAEADDGALGLELGADDPHRLEDRRRPLLRVGHAHPLDVGRRFDPPLDHRSDAFDELDRDAHAEDRRHDVREHHRRVDAVPAHRLRASPRRRAPASRPPRRSRGARGSPGTPAAIARPGA